MDPVSIVGVAAAAIQFYSFTTSIATATWRATSSSQNIQADASDLKTVSARFEEIVELLDTQLQAIKTDAEGTRLSKPELLLQKFCADCLPKAKKLHTASSKLATKMNHSGQIQDFWKALKAEFKEGDIRSLTDTLSKLRDDIIPILLACLWESSKRTQDVMATLNTQMAALHDAVLRTPQNSLSQPEASTFVQDVATREASQVIPDKVDWKGEPRQSVWHELKKDFASIQLPRRTMNERESSSSKHLRLARDIISELKYNQMATRHDAIAAPHSSTFDWIWYTESDIPKIQVSGQQVPKWSSLPAWLAGPSTTPYWVTGRPGSGKSTLMKFIEGHHNLQEHLEKWEPELPLHVLNYYAWNPGTAPQKSIEGLIRTILFQLLENEPQLLPLVMPRRWAFWTTTWSNLYPPEFEAEDMEQLEEGLMSLLSNARPNMKLMILVDGLDEFDVAPEEQGLIRTLESISRHDNVKLCVASRPWNKFRDAFGSGARLKIHDLTEEDIAEFVRDKFEQSRVTQKHPARAEALRTEIQTYAGGVFQWVAVVVNFVLGKLQNGDPHHDIMKMLQQLPEDLSDLYTTIWSRMSLELQGEAKGIFKLQSTAPMEVPLDYATIWCVNERQSDAAAIEVLKEAANDPQKMRDTVVRYLNSRTYGLLELDPKGNVVVLHRTITEWLRKHGVLEQSTVEEHVTSTLQAHMNVLRGVCVLGGHIDSIDGWHRQLPLLVYKHLIAVSVSPTWSDKLTEDLVCWLKELEEHSDRLDFVNVLGDLRNVSNEFQNTALRDIWKYRFVDLVAKAGFHPFVASHLEHNKGTPSRHLLTYCTSPFDSWRIWPISATGSLKDSLLLRLDLQRLCLKYDGVYHRLSFEGGTACSPKDLALDLHSIALYVDRYRAHVREHEAYKWYYKTAIDIILTHQRGEHSFFRRSKDKALLFLKSSERAPLYLFSGPPGEVKGFTESQQIRDDEWKEVERSWQFHDSRN